MNNNQNIDTSILSEVFLAPSSSVRTKCACEQAPCGHCCSETNEYGASCRANCSGNCAGAPA